MSDSHSANKGKITLYGWYSSKCANSIGYVVYTTPENQEVRVTNVTRIPEDNSKWDDTIFRGEVLEFVSGFRLGQGARVDRHELIHRLSF